MSSNNNLRLSIRHNYVSSFAKNARMRTGGLLAFITIWLLESPQDKGTMSIYLDFFFLLFVDTLSDWRQSSLVKLNVCRLHSLTISLSCLDLKPTALLKLLTELSSSADSCCRLIKFYPMAGFGVFI